MRLVLGTAAFNPAGYNNLPPVPIQEIRKIFSCAKEGGINIIDTAESYQCHDLITKETRGFCIYTKTRDWRVHLDWGDNELRGILYHYQPEELLVRLPFIHRWVNLGVSVYNTSQLPSDYNRIIQVPLNLQNRDFENCFNLYRTIFIRSIFGNGSLLNKNSVVECLDFVSRYRSDGIIVGVRSVSELEHILKCAF